QWVGFFDGNLALKKVRITGGPAVAIARVDGFERGATWAPDGTIIYATRSTAIGLLRVRAGGGTPKVLTRSDGTRGEVGHAWPNMLPGGQGLLYSVLPKSGGLDAASLAVFDLRSGTSTILLGGGTDARYEATGHLLYGSAGSLRAVRFDASRLSIVGQSVPVVPQVATTAFGGVDAVLANDGTLVYVMGSGGSGAARTLAWVDRQGREAPLAAPPYGYYFPRISPDTTRIAVNAVVEQNSDIWTWDLARSTLNRVTTAPALDAFPAWLPDSRQLVFGSNRAGAFNLFRQSADGTGAVERLTDTASSQFPSAVSPDGKSVLISELSATTGYDVMTMALDGAR